MPSPAVLTEVGATFCTPGRSFPGQLNVGTVLYAVESVYGLGLVAIANLAGVTTV